MKKIASLLALAAFSLCQSQAQEKPAGDKPAGPPPGERGGPGKGRPTPEQIMERLDTDKDGFISEAEFKAGPRAKAEPDKAGEMFKKIDTDKDGKISLEELKKAPRPQGPPPGGDGGPGQAGKGKGDRKGPPGPPPGPPAADK
jgi:EF-hand domain pair